MRKNGFIGLALLLSFTLAAGHAVDAAKRRARSRAASPATSPGTPVPAGLELVSRADPNQSSATAGALMVPQVNQRAFSADGRYVVFQSSSENLITGLTESKVTTNIYLHDRATHTTVLVSHVPAAPTTAINGDCFVPTISGDGRFVVYWTFATDVVPNQVDHGDGTPDIFIYDRTTGTNTLVSHVPGALATAADSNSYDPTISKDGRFVSFTSAASNLVAGQSNGGAFSSIFVWDRVTDTIKLVSHKSGDPVTTSDGSQFNSIMNDDGSVIAFLSNGSNLVPGQSQPASRFQIFLWNRATDTTALVSHNAGSATTATNGASFYPILNSDGNYLVYYSAGTDVIANQVDVNQNYDVFLYERATGTNTLVSHSQSSAATASTMASLYPSISGDGRFVVYQSASPDLVANDLNNVEDVMLWDRTTNTNVLLSKTAAPLLSASGNAKSFGAHISADGNTVAFTSNAGDLVTAQTASGKGDIFFFDRSNSTLHLVSHLPGSNSTGGNDESFLALPSDDGSWIAYNTLGSDVVANDSNGSGDVMVYDRAADANLAASARPANLSSVSANGQSGSHHASADGRFVVFVSDASNLAPNQSDANNANDIFVRDRQNGTTVLVSHTAGAPASAGNDLSDSPVISADGRWIAYASKATDLVSGMVNASGGANVFLYDRVNDTTMLVSHSIAGASITGSDISFLPELSGDGRLVAYTSYAVDLIAGQTDSNDNSDVFVFDRTTGTNTLVSHANAAANATGLDYSFAPAVSSDGKFIAYYSAATDLVPNQSNAGNGVQHGFLYETATGTAVMIDHQFGAVATSGDGNAGSTEPLDPPVFSADGASIAYASSSTNLVSGQDDTNNDYDIFVFDRLAGTNALVSHRGDSMVGTGRAIAYNPSISADGRFVSYRSEADNLVAGQNDTNTFQDVFLFDRTTRQNVLVSHAFRQPAKAGDGLAGESPRYGYQSVSPDGRFVAFWSSSTDLVPDMVDQNGISGDLYLFDRLSGANILLSHAAGLTSTGGNGASGDSLHIGGPVWTDDGRTLLFASRATDLIANDYNNREDVFALNLPLLPVSAVSRKLHGPAGLFDLELLGNQTTESRTGGPNGQHQLVVSFAGPITFDSASLVGTGSVMNASVNQGVITVNLTGIANAQTITVTLHNVTDGSTINDVGVTMRVLAGDTNADGEVNTGDVSQTKANSGTVLTSSNCRLDLNCDGDINSGDTSIAKSLSGTALSSP